MMAVSASRARVCSQFLFLACMLYFRPFCSNAVSLLVKEMSVLFMTLGWNVCFSFGVVVCAKVSLSSFFVQCLVFGLCFMLEFFFNCVLNVWPGFVPGVGQGYV